MRVIAIDGPAGAGKSSTVQRLAQRIGFTLVDTGAIYRCVALTAERRGIDWDDVEALGALTSDLDVDFRFAGGVNQVLLAGEDVSAAIRTQEISWGASRVARHPPVRAGLLELQRQLGRRQASVLEGRDIGTVVFPDAPLKVFLDASDEERARRRCAQLDAQGTPKPFAEVLEEIRRRDAQDRGRAVAPLKAADDAIVLDTTAMSEDAVVDWLEAQAREHGLLGD